MSYEKTMGVRDAVALQIEPSDRRFLRSVFAMARDGIRDELAAYPGQLREPQRLYREEAVYDELLAALERGSIEPSGDIRGVLDDLAATVDGANEYERVVAEHEALHGLRRQLACAGREGVSANLS